MSKLPLRARLTLLVAALFAIALTTAAVVGLDQIETSLETETRDNAEALLFDYIGQLEGGALGAAQPDAQEATRFLYLGPDGAELNDAEFRSILFTSIESGFEPFPLPEGFPPLPDELATGGIVIVEAGQLPIAINSAVGDQPIALDQGDDVTAVGLGVTIGEQDLTIGVSSPLRPVRDSIDAMTRLFLILVPALTLLIAGGTWFLVGRALRPVSAITTHVDRITTHNLEERVPETEATDEIGHLARTMNKMLAGLHTARDQQRQFISDASHELRSPITATRATLDVARANPGSTDWLATAKILHDENTRLATLVDDLLVLARFDETRSVDLKDDIDLDELFLAEAERPHACPVGVKVDSPVRLQGDLSAMTRAARNLVENAARHASSSVVVTIAVDESHAIVSIADDGPGIPDADLDRIFERFTRLDDSRQRSDGGGAGLGLAITKQIIAAHNGTITATNPTSGGALFTLTFPFNGGVAPRR